MLDPIIQIDTDLFLALNSRHSPFWDEAMYLVTGKFEWLLMYVTVLFALFKTFGLKATLIYLLLIVLIISLADQITASLIRPAVGRLRPSSLDNPISDLVHIVKGSRGGSYGFPSSHAANAFAIATFLCLVFRRLPFSIFIVLWAFLMCYSRIYLGKHYPGDLVAGMFIGTACGMAGYFISSLVIKYLGRRNRYLIPEITPYKIGKGQKGFKVYPCDLIIFTGVLTFVVILIYSAVILHYLGE